MCFDKSEHIIYVLRYLHWLPVELWVDYKVNLHVMQINETIQ